MKKPLKEMLKKIGGRHLLKENDAVSTYSAALGQYLAGLRFDIRGWQMSREYHSGSWEWTNRKFDNAFYASGDPLINHPIFSEFNTLAKTWLSNPVQKFNAGGSFIKYSDWRDEIYEWLADHPLEGDEFKGNKTKRKEIRRSVLIINV